jgi:hypothetical protein
MKLIRLQSASPVTYRDIHRTHLDSSRGAGPKGWLAIKQMRRRHWRGDRSRLDAGLVSAGALRLPILYVEESARATARVHHTRLPMRAATVFLRLQL